MITINQLWRYLHERPLSVTALAELLDLPQDEVAEALQALKDAGVVALDGQAYGLIDPEARPTEIRDQLVLQAVRNVGRASREELDDHVPASTSAQVYTSLRRLLLTGRVRKLRTGTRTPHYQAA